jgi:hypothetical protein
LTSGNPTVIAAEGAMMNTLESGNHRRIGVLSLTLALAGIGGCGSAEPEAVEPVVRALGSTKAQQTIGNWTQLTQMSDSSI